MKAPRGNTDREVELRMTPMIDVVFLLLVFFVWTSSFDEPEYDLPSTIALPPSATTSVAAGASPEPFEELVIRIEQTSAESAQGSFISLRLNDKTVDSVESLQQRLQQIVSLGVQPPVIIDPDPEIQVQQVVRIYDIARAAGCDRILFAASM